MNKIYISLLIYIFSINLSHAGIFDLFSGEPEVTVSYGLDSGCSSPYMLSVEINNKSSKEINSSNIKAYARYKNYSDKIIFFHTMTSRIIPSGETYSFCAQASNAEYDNKSSVFRIKNGEYFLKKYGLYIFDYAVNYGDHANDSRKLDNYLNNFISDNIDTLKNMDYELEWSKFEYKE